MKFIKRPSPNFNERANGKKPEMIILHYTGGKNTEYALNILSDATRAARVSCHYLIDESGKIYEMVAEKKRAWHAGVSKWHNETDINSISIGIELSNRDNKPYPPKQISALSKLCNDIIKRYNIKPANILGHSDIAPNRKQDPGEHFPWKNLAKQDIGIWPKISIKDKFNATAVAKDKRKVKNLLKKLGYPVKAFGDSNPKFKELIIAFQRRFEPNLFTEEKHKEKIGTASKDTVAKLRALIRQNKK